ncbi:MAG: AraC family transcriptional regulator [Clostridiales bacterium]|nr:AraC family transcriptional regulator [Clostridiales bacterium]
MEKKKKKRSFLSFLRFNSIYLKTLLILSALIFVVGITFFGIMGHYYQQQYVEEYFSGCGVSLSSISNSFDTFCRESDLRFQDLFKQEECNEVIIRGETYQSENAFRVVRELGEIAEGEKWISQINIYVAANHSVLSSDKSITDASEWIASDPSSSWESDIQNMGKKGKLLYRNGNLYWVRTLPEKKNLSIFWVRFDKEALMNDLANDWKGHPVTLYLNGEVLLSQLENPQPENDLMTTDKHSLNEETILYYRPDGGYYLKYSSGYTNLDYIISVDKGEVGMVTKQMLLLLAPILLVMILLVGVVAFLLVRTVYRPIHGILRQLMAGRDLEELSEEKTHINTELDLMAYLKEENEKGKNSLHEMLREVSSAVTEQIFTEMLHQESSDMERNLDLLQQIDSPFLKADKFQVDIVYLISGSKNNNGLELEDILVGEGIRRRVISFWRKKNVCVCAKEDKQNQETFVLGFSDQVSSGQIKQWHDEIDQMLEEESKDLNGRLKFGSSRLRTDLDQLKSAYDEAEKMLRERMYYQMRGEDFSEISLMVETQMEKILNQICTDKEEGMEAYGHLLEMVEDHKDIAVSCYLKIIDRYLEKMIRMCIECPESLRRKRHILEANTSSLQDYDVRRQQIRDFGEEAAELIHKAAGKNQYLYVESAKKYIEDHYDDGNLSLQLVSESCGVSSSYLSRLFANYASMGFLDYLNQFRSHQAALLLENTDYTVADIGFKTGFTTPQNFSRVFRRCMGETPGQYRLRKREGKNEEPQE